MRSSRTAEYVAAYRAFEHNERRREPLFSDPLARVFLPRRLRLAVGLARVPGLRAVIERYADSRAPGARASAICRTRLIDDVVRRETVAGARQLVILGAGFDTRAHRLQELSSSTVFEVDQPATQARKRALLARAPQALASGRVVYVAVDFLREKVEDRLRAASYEFDARTIFIWEGVSNYLTQPAVEGVLAMVGCAAPDSVLVFTYIHRGVIDGSVPFEGGALLRSNTQRLGEPWRFGLDPAQTPVVLARFGLQLELDLSADQYRERYSWASNMRGYAFYHAAVARVARAT